MFVVLIAGLSAGFVGFITKIIIREKYSSTAYTLLWTIVGSIIFFPLLVLQPCQSLTKDILPWLCLCLAGFCFSMANREMFTAFKTIDFSMYSIIFRLNMIVAILGSIIFFNDRLTINKLLGIIAIFTGIIIVFLDTEKRFSFSRGSVHVLVAAVLVGIAAVFNKQALSFLPISIVAFGNYFLQIPFVFSRGNLKQALEITRLDWRKVLIVAVLIPIAWGGYAFALQKSNISIVQPVYQTLQFITQMSLGIVVLKERDHLARKFTGFALNLAGIILVCLG